MNRSPLHTAGWLRAIVMLSAFVAASAAAQVRINNGVTGPGRWEVYSGNAGDTSTGYITSPDGVTRDVLFAFNFLVDPGADGAASYLQNSTTTAAYAVGGTVQSSGSFAGQNGTVAWTSVASIAPGSAVYNVTLTFQSSSPFGTLRVISYLDEDVTNPDDVLIPIGTPGSGSFQLLTIARTINVGVAQAAGYRTATNAAYVGWAAMPFSSLISALTGAGASYSVNGVVSGLSATTDSRYPGSAAWGPADITSAIAFDLNPSATLASIVFSLGGSPTGLPVQLPSLSISKTAPSSVVSGSNLTYTINYSNTGQGSATGTTITDPVPGNTTFVSATNGGTYSGGVVTWNIGTVQSGAGGSVQFTVRVNSGPSVTNTNYKIQATSVSPVTGSDVVTTVVPSCNAPGTPTALTISPKNPAVPGAPPTGTDTLVLSWQPGSGQTPTRYEYWLNADAPASTTSTSVEVAPRGSATALTLNVRAIACSPELVSGTATMSAAVSLAKPHANFSIPSSANLNTQVTLTDTSSPQATAWLWIFSDGTSDTRQSQTHTFAASGTHQVALVATNGSGSDVVVKSISISPGARPLPVSESARRFDASGEFRQALPHTQIGPLGRSWLHVQSRALETAVVYLRLIDDGGIVRLERRLVVEAGGEGVFDVAAYGVLGDFTLETFSLSPVVSTLVERAGDDAPGHPDPKDPR